MNCLMVIKIHDRQWIKDNLENGTYLDVVEGVLPLLDIRIGNKVNLVLLVDDEVPTLLRARQRFVAHLHACMQVFVVCESDLERVKDVVGEVSNVNQLSILHLAKRLLNLLIGANGLKDRTRTCRLHLDLKCLTEYDLAIKVHLWDHSLAVDGEEILLGAKVVVFFQIVLCVQEILVAGHYQNLAFLDLLAGFFGLVSVHLSSDVLLNDDLVGRFLGWEAGVCHSTCLWLLRTIIHDSITAIDDKANLAFFNQFVSALDICLELIGLVFCLHGCKA